MQRFQILLDVVDGLVYLHLIHKSVHLDLKSPNILLEKIVFNDDAARTDRSDTSSENHRLWSVENLQQGQAKIATNESDTEEFQDCRQISKPVTMSKRKGYGHTR